MTIEQVIAQVDKLRRNTYDRKEKIRWLSQVEMRVRHKIIDTHEGAPAEPFAGYDETTPRETVLLVPAPYDELYLRYLEAQMEYYDQQEERYNNAMDLFDAAWLEFAKWYNRNHMPLEQKLKY